MAEATPRALRFSAIANEARPQGKISIREAEIDDASRVMEAFSATFGVARPGAYWTEKFVHHGRPCSVIAVDEAGIVHAQFAAYPATLCDGQDTRPVLMSADVFARRSVHAIQAKLFVRTMQRFHDLFGFGGPFSAVLGFPNHVARGLYHRTLDIAADLRTKEYRYLRPRAPGRLPLVLVRTVGRRLGRLKVESAASMTDQFRTAAGRVHRARSAAVLVEFHRDVAWLDWRYRRLSPYYGDYCFHVVSWFRRQIGWIVTRQMGSDICIVDWRFLPTKTCLLEAAVAEIVSTSKADRTLALMSAPTHGECNGSQWRYADLEIPFVAMLYNPISIPFEWLNLTYGDTDLR